MNIEKERKAYLIQELKEYEKVTPMNQAERKALRDWVKSGYSVHDNPSMTCYDGGCPVDFLDIYREEEYLRNATQGMNAEETRRFVMDYYGWDDTPVDPNAPSLEEELMALECL